MKPNTAAHILLSSPLLVSLCFARPAQAAIQSTPQAMSQPSISVASSVLSGQPLLSTSFYQQQLDKLKYAPEILPRSRPSSSPREKNKQQNIQPPVTPATSNSISLDNKKRERPNQLSTSKADSDNLGDTQSKDKSDTSQSIKKRLQQQVQKQVQKQNRNLTGNSSPFSPTPKNTDGETNRKINKVPNSVSRRDPRDILDAAQQKHNPLQGRHLELDFFSTENITNQINVRKPDLAPLKQQIPEKIDQLKAEIRSNIQQQPEQLQQALTAAKTDLQQRSAQKIEGPLNSLNTFIQRNLKDPLSRLLKKVGIAAQTTAEQLQKSE